MRKEDPVEEGRADEGGPPDSEGDGAGDVWEFLDLRDLVNDPKAVTWNGASVDEAPAADPGQDWDFLDPRDLDRQNRVVAWNGESKDEKPSVAAGTFREEGLTIGNGGRAVTWNGNGNRRNGLASARGLVNGNGMINGNGFVNGTGKGLSGGSGLVNGNGLVNGCERPMDGSPFQARPASGWRHAAAGKRLRLALLAAIAAGLVMGVPLIAMLALPPDEGMAVDGDLSDWAGTTVLSDGVDGRVGSPDQDIVRYATAVSGNDVLFLVKVAGSMLAGKGEAVDFVNAFIDSDSDSSTGYSIRGMGADNRLEAWGFGGQSRGCTFYGFSPARGNADWNGWNTLGSGKAAAVQAGLELSAWKSGK